MVHLTLSSSNVKTGPIPVSGSASSTCPDACPLKNKGCYAASGPIRFAWNKVDSNKWGDSWEKFIGQVSKLAKGQIWRHNQFGDLRGKNNLIDKKALKELVEANKEKRGFTYSHYPMTKKANREAVKHANDNGFTINLSCETVEQADKVKALNVGPVVTILPSTHDGQSFITEAGNKVVVCPAQTKEYVTCASCQLCQKANRGAIIGFIAHGTSKKKVDKVVQK